MIHVTWSTRELAGLAGTTVKAVRHYHQVGLLEEPERLANGYKQYTAQHLVQLLQIRRLVDLGMPLARIAQVRAEGDDPGRALELVESEVMATIERLQRVHAELAEFRRSGGSVDLPPEFGDGANELSPSDRALLLVLSRVLTKTAMDEIRQMVNSGLSAAERELSWLPADADTATKVRLAADIAAVLRERGDRYDWVGNPRLQASDRAESTVVKAVSEFYNLAQLEVLYRAHLLVTGQAYDDRLPAVLTG